MLGGEICMGLCDILRGCLSLDLAAAGYGEDSLMFVRACQAFWNHHYCRRVDSEREHPGKLTATCSMLALDITERIENEVRCHFDENKCCSTCESIAGGARNNYSDNCRNDDCNDDYGKNSGFLELGCGEGHLSAFLLARNRSHTLFGKASESGKNLIVDRADERVAAAQTAFAKPDNGVAHSESLIRVRFFCCCLF